MLHYSSLPSSITSFLLPALLHLLTFSSFASSQQPYQGLNSSHHACFSNQNDGYLCSDTQLTCLTYSIFFVTPQAPSISHISNLFNVSVAQIAAVNQLSTTQELFLDQYLLIPLHCSCFGNHSTASTTYSLGYSDTFYKVATSVYENLTTCRALLHANPNLDPFMLQPRQQIHISLRCACPSKYQQQQGVKYLVTYPVQTGDTISSVSSKFNVSNVTVANEISDSDFTLYPGSTLLLPFTEIPTLPQFPVGSKRIWTKLLYLVIALCLSSSLLLALSFLGYYFWKRSSKGQQGRIGHGSISAILPKMFDYVRREKPTVFSISEIEESTNNFSDSSILEGSVFKGIVRGGLVVAIRRKEGDVSEELKIMSKLHHTSLVRLVGFCVTSPYTYLVYEYAENGSLSMWLRGKYSLQERKFYPLSWKVRLQIALDVATGLQYMHEHTGMELVHTNIDSSNILLDGNMRAKIANYGKAATSKETKKELLMKKLVMGRCEYIAPEYVQQGKVSPKVDVFAFGVVLMELLLGREAAEAAEETGGMLWRWIGIIMDGENAKDKLRQWIDERMEDAFMDAERDLEESVLAVAMLARSSVYEDPIMRPSMSDLAFSLSKLVQQ